MVAFIPNGLLRSTLPLESDNTGQKNSSSKAAMFIPNGLLGSLSGPSELNVEPEMISPKTKPFTQFVANGLLSNNLAEFQNDAAHPAAWSGGCEKVIDSSILNSPIINTQATNDDPPPVSEAFGLSTSISAIEPSTGITSHGHASTSRFSIRAITFDGKAIYIKRKPKVSHVARNKALPSVQKMGNLLDVPIHRLIDQLSAATAAHIQRADGPITISASSPERVEDTLWVDRYRPRKFTEMMGNERVARETMAWVKQWDWCVFGSKRGRKRPKNGDENYDGEDEYHRPREKFLLLSGPPGLGKTTLAHVVARQAGYEVVEINASDARSGSIVDDRIRPTLESGSMVGSTKPVLLVIDEIDGATGTGENSNSFVQKLVQLTYDRPRKKRRSGQNRDPQAKRPILRPIICICNDQNASSLAKLKPHAYHIRFQRPADIHIVNRLREICEIESLKADSRALSTLVGAAKGDLRGCLNALQFIKARDEEVTEAMIRSATAGMKEGDISLNSVLNDLFSPLTRKRVKELGISEEEGGKYVVRLSREIEGSGRETSIALGCFAHYATLRQHDANFSRYERANEWLATFDILSAGMYSNGDFTLSSYLPYTLVPFYPLFQERGGQRVERNQADWENLQLTQTNEEILKSLSRCLRSASTRLGGDFRHLLSTPVLQLEFAPFINRIISPPLRPVNSQVIKAEEKALLTRLVSIMVSLELRFFQERSEDGHLSYRLDPPVDVFVTYDGKRATDIAVSRYAVRHLVAGEIDAQLIARDADVIEKGKRRKHDFFGKASSSKRSVETEDDELNNGFSKRPKVDIADKPPTDFFGRVILVPSVASTKAAARRNVEKKYRVLYRYKEGNSAAVRKPVKVGAFL